MFSVILSLSNIIFLQFHLEVLAQLVRSIEAIRASSQEKKNNKSRDSTCTLEAKVNAVKYIVQYVCSQCSNKIGYCCDNKLSVIKTADRFKIC